ncbi:MAG TPA: PEP-CTERM sorting domain-containing protein [Lacipirellula sp.]
MKISNWCRNVAATLLVAGIWIPSVSYAVSIPLGDPSFEDFVVPAVGYAYSNEYRPTSAWVDDLDSPPGYTQDDGNSAWLYNSAYAEDASNSRRGAPRTGNQAMHGLANYSAQETTAVFEANRTYTFSLWAQNDELLDQSNGLFMYIFDATVPFSDGNSLANLGGAFTAINARQAGMTAAQSQANWTQVSVSHTVAPGAPEIGHPIGVGFFARRDTSVDDATLTAIPEPASAILVGIGGLALLARRQRE